MEIRNSESIKDFRGTSLLDLQSELRLLMVASYSIYHTNLPNVVSPI